jgi:hypothetical protein
MPSAFLRPEDHVHHREADLAQGEVDVRGVGVGHFDPGDGHQM